MKQKIDIEIIEAEQFKIIHIASNPPRIETKIVFDRDNISQRLIFTLMEITHNHGFGCSPPDFNCSDSSIMTFLIGTILPTKKSVNKYVKKLYNCLLDIVEFSNEFEKQLDFSRLDLSMFVGMDIEEFSPEQIAAIKDQNYNGSWEDYYKDLLSQGKNLEASVISCCIKFEEVNDKDIGLVGHQLSHLIQLIDESSEINIEAN